MELTQEILKEFLEYNPDTGDLIWKKRDRKWFKSGRGWEIFNSVFAGNTAGYTKKDSKCDHYSRILIRTPDGKQTSAQNIIWCIVYGYLPKTKGMMVDHEDGDSSNNRLSNLRLVDYFTNNQNAKKRKDNVSGVTGVYFDKRSGKWVSVINAYNKRIHLGTFKTFEDAVATRKEAENKYGFHENHGRD